MTATERGWGGGGGLGGGAITLEESSGLHKGSAGITGYEHIPIPGAVEGRVSGV